MVGRTGVVAVFGCALLVAGVAAAEPTGCPSACAAPPCAEGCLVPPPVVVPGALRIPVAGIARAALPAEAAGRDEAIDIAAPPGAPVVAADDGTIAKLLTSDSDGLTVHQLDPSGRLVYTYSHLGAYAPDLQEGMPVVRGQPLGSLATSARGDAPHLRFAIRRLDEAGAWWTGDPIDPRPHLVEGDASGAGAIGPYGTTAALEQALARVSAAASAGGWPTVGAGPTLERGATGDRVGRLRERLAASGDLVWIAASGARDGPGAPGAEASFDAALEQAVRRFQVRHGLAPDGRVGPETRAALDRSAAQRAAQIAANLEARRRLEAGLEPRFVLVNVPDYRLVVVDEHATTLTMAVAVGRPDWSTPPIDDRIERIVVNPAWNVPASIVSKELAPKLARDPGYLKRNGMVRLAGGGVRQRPGPRNPLGRLKFVFPNHAAIYLHDTPGQAVFDRRERDVSHGCLRLDDARALAELLLRDVPGWDRAQLDAAIATGRTEEIPLAAPIPIHVVYWTAWVDADGTLQLRKDLYAGKVDPDTPPLTDAASAARAGSP
jgi:lipoprotein-anchoring transpeptidase ErfK/SrfK